MNNPRLFRLLFALATLPLSACGQSEYVAPAGHFGAGATPSPGATVTPVANASATPVASSTPAATPTASAAPTPSATPASMLYVVNRNVQGDQGISVFPAAAGGNIAPSFTLFYNDATLNNLTFDARGGLYIAYPDESLSSIGYVSPPVTATSTEQFITYANLYAPQDIAVDSSGYIYVLDPESGGSVAPSIFVFAPGATGASVPVRTISGSATLLTGATSIAVSPTTIYVGQYLAGSAAVLEYPLSSNGNVTPTQLTGNSTEISDPFSVRIDSLGRLVVDNQYCTSGSSCAVTILRFNGGATGNTAPASSIDVSAFEQLGEGPGECLDAQSNLFLPRYENQTSGATPAIGMFPPTDSGTASPNVVISGSNTGLNFPTYCAVH